MPTDPGYYADPQFIANWKKTGIDACHGRAAGASLAHTKYNFLENPFIFPDGSTIYNNALGQILTELANVPTTMKAAARQINQGIASASSSGL